MNPSESSSSEEEFEMGTGFMWDQARPSLPSEFPEPNEEEEDYSESDSHDTPALISRGDEEAPTSIAAYSCSSFAQLQVSRPLLLALEAQRITTPRPVQTAAIPPVLRGEDVCVCALTGSGKTLAFVLPVVERLQYRNRDHAATRALLLCPTRELARQVARVVSAIVRNTGLSTSLLIGGVPLEEQTAQLQLKPDIVIGTPGRVLDHFLNSASFSLDNVDFLVLDEADRLLDAGFSAEIEEIVKNSPKKRQTLLFSATMSTEVEKLKDLSLKRPAMISVNEATDLNHTLKQEFVRLSLEQESDRVFCEASLLALCTHTYPTRTIVFCRSKKECHRVFLLFKLAQLSVTELHGNLSQNQRILSLEKFRDNDVDFLVCTDLASRGLDILGIETVVNFALPHHFKQYLHRVGRTARSGKDGLAVSFAGEKDQELLRVVVSKAKNKLTERIIDPPTVQQMISKVQILHPEIENILLKENEDKELFYAERDARKADNLLKFQKDIIRKPKRTWFLSEREKNQNKKRSRQQFENERTKLPLEPVPNSKKKAIKKPKLTKEFVMQKTSKKEFKQKGAFQFKKDHTKKSKQKNPSTPSNPSLSRPKKKRSKVRFKRK